METNRPHITAQGFIGVFIVLLGIVFTLDNLGLVESREILQYWPLAPLGIGLLIVIHANETRDWIRGSVWLAAGSVLLARNLGWLHFRIESFWPLLLVFFGLHIMFKAREDPVDRLQRRAEEFQRKRDRWLRKRGERWQRRVERWQERHPGEATPNDWAAKWAKDWNEKWNEKWHAKWHETEAKFHDDWQKRFHEKFPEDWQERLRSTIERFAHGTREHDVPIDVDVRVDVPGTGGGTNVVGGTSTGTSSGGGTSAGARAPGAGGSPGTPGSPGAAGSPGGAASTGWDGSAGNPAAASPGAGVGGANASSSSSFSSTAGTDPQSSATGPFVFQSGSSAGSGYGARSDAYDTQTTPNSPHRISMFSLMSGVTRRVRNMPFYGANMTAVMGGIQLDLRQAQLPDDAVIELFAFWGGIEIWVPREWSVVNQGFALMGSIEDKTGNLPQRPGQPRLVLRGMALMGGVEIRN